MKPSEVQVAVLRMEGTNGEEEMARAWRRAGARAGFVHLKELESGNRSLEEFHALALPGGFSAGDYVRAGAVFAARLRPLARDLARFVEEGRLVLGVCNGFQVMVELGLLPGDGTPGEPAAALAVNASGRFECRPTLVRREGGCDFTRRTPRGRVLEMPVAHGEGRLAFGRPQTLRWVEEEGLVAFRYTGPGREGRADPPYPFNPSGSIRAIAGLRNPAGNVLGLMPHPERAVDPWARASWGREARREGDGAPLFASAVEALRKRF